MIEELTASLREDTVAADSRASMMRDAWVARMVQFGAVPIAIAALLNLLEFYQETGTGWSLALGCAWFNLFLGVSSLCLAPTRWFTRNWRPLTFFLLTALIASDTVLGALGQEPILLFISLILLMVGTGSILPWSIQFQVSFNLLCLAAWMTQNLWVPSVDGKGAYKMAGLITAAALSYFTCYMRDRFVREHEESERKVRESEAVLRQIFDANTDGITIIDLKTRRVVDVNEQFLRLTGFAREEVVGKTTHELNVWTDPAIEKEFVHRIRTNETVKNLEVSFRIKDGRIIPCLLSSVLVVIQGRPCVMTLARDIGDVRESQEKLRDSEEKFRLIFESCRDSIMMTRASDTIILEVNDHFIGLLGFTREEAIGRTALELGLWTNLEHRSTFISNLVECGYIDAFETTMRTRDGRHIPVLMSAATVRLAGGDCYLGMVRDISRLREAERKTRDSEATLRRIFDASLDWMSISELSTGAYLDVNESFVQSTGYRREEIIGSNFWKLRLWPDQKEWQDFTANLILRGEVRNQPATFRRRDGTLIPSLISAVQCELWGKPCCIAAARDITDLNDAQAKLRRSEETFRKIFETSLDAMSITDARTGEYIDVNPAFLRTTRFNREEIIGKTTPALALWVDAQAGEELRRALKEKGEVRSHSADIRAKDGGILSCVISGVLAEIGGRTCCLAVTRDVTELKEAEQKLRQSEATLRAIFDNSLDSILLLDSNTQTLVEVNSELTKVIGYSREEMLGKSLAELVPPADPVRQEQLVAALMQGREVRNFEITFASRQGRHFPALVSASTVLIEGKPCTLAVSRDITDLVAAREAALAASRAKSEFLSIMSHEIRTPMNAILGMADLMGESELNSEQRRYLDTVLSNGNALLELINSILDLAKVESGRLSLESVEFEVAELAERAADTLAVSAYEKRLELTLHFAPNLPAVVIGDPHRLRQILNNLIGNAIKFTQRGEVVVEVGLNPDPARPGNHLFSVRDTGIGIAPDKIENIFSVFTQADTSTTRKFGGSGLGLTIVERLVGMMGGQVWVQSEVGSGSTFFFTADLRISESPSLEARSALEPELAGIRSLMLVENTSTRDMVGELLRAKGAHVIEAASESDALAALDAASREGPHFRLLLIDCDIVGNDEFEVARRLRDATSKAAIVLLMNPYGVIAKLRYMREQGLKFYSTKPIKARELYGVLAEALLKGVPPQVSLEAPPQASPFVAIAQRPLRILLADDSPDNRLLIGAYTKKTPYLLTEAENGQIAVERFIDGVFDLVLMDLQMPVLDGYGAARAIRQFEQEKGRNRTPIIALTASALEEDVRRAKEAGCDVHVSKPVKKSTLLASIAQAIEAHCKAVSPEIVVNGNAVIAVSEVLEALNPVLTSG